MSFLHTSSSIPVLFPSMTTAVADQAVVKYSITGSKKQHGLDMTRARTNFRQLGVTVKKMTCLLPTRERVMLSTQVMSRLCPCSSLSPTSQLMSLCGVFLHQLVDGWTDEECVLAAGLVFSTFNSGGAGGAVSAVVAPSYQLGSRPELEMHVRNFLASVFYKEVASGQQRLWLETLLLQTSPERNSLTMSRVMLLISSPAREEDWQFGVLWADHVEAIPATLAVASARYNTLVSLLNIIKQGQLGPMLPSLLFSIFQTPSPWLPENVGSVLLLLGHQTCHLYLQHTVRQVATRDDVCTNCFKSVSTAVTGLALMTARSRRSFGPVFARLEEVIMHVPGQHRENLFKALWGALAEEVTDLRQNEGEDWAMEGSMHLFKVIRMIGQRMTEKAYMHLPSTSEDWELVIEE
eukprot:GFUD01016362.1.p1 GENE.GFUD01016362.1~~GFUD01016362.1.p1  ORF type:complete len:470 (-),score=202.14 GFUD01016362.1:265-1485(-)